METAGKYSALISVVMPAYNCEKFIRKAIDSILSQTYVRFELLVADDASTDRTKEIIDSYKDPRIKRFHNDRNTGYLKTCNKLFSQAEGDYITFQDADDFSANNRLEKLLEAFGQDKDLGMCGSNFSFVDTNDQVVFSSSYPLEHDALKKIIPDDFPFCGAALMIKKEVYEVIGGYDELFDRIGCEDFYWLGLIIERYKAHNLPDILYYYRHNPNSVSRNIQDHRKLYSVEIVKHLLNQRKETGTDDLESGNSENLSRFLETLEKPYKNDPAFFYRRMANWAFEKKENRKALKFCLQAVKAAPFNLYNIRTLFYFLRQILKNR